MQTRDQESPKRLIPDERGRITLGKIAEGVSSYKLSRHKDGSLTLTPMAEIPARELWLWKNEGALASVLRGLEQAKRGEIEPLDLSTLPDDD